MYFKFEQRSSGAKAPQRAEGVFIQWFLKKRVGRRTRKVSSAPFEKGNREMDIERKTLVSNDKSSTGPIRVQVGTEKTALSMSSVLSSAIALLRNDLAVRFQVGADKADSSIPSVLLSAIVQLENDLAAHFQVGADKADSSVPSALLSVIT